MGADALSRESAHLKDRLAKVEAALAEVQEANRRLEYILRTSQREQFGRRSEKLSPDQFNLPLENAELPRASSKPLRRRPKPRCDSRVGKNLENRSATVVICRRICPVSSA
jgi:hypothetical protein